MRFSVHTQSIQTNSKFWPRNNQILYKFQTLLFVDNIYMIQKKLVYFYDQNNLNQHFLLSKNLFLK